MSSMIKFEDRVPSAQNAVDIFRDRWACDLNPLLGVDGTGPNLLFTQDKRPEIAAAAFGLKNFEGMDVLEIGPLEGAHTWLIEKLGARSIVCVEASVEAWIKCLIVKELLSMTKSRFLLGDIVGYLEEETRSFDIVFCSGVFYHMEDPLRLIKNISNATNRCFVWTHVYHPDRHPVEFQSSIVEREGVNFNYWSHRYGSKEQFHWGGVSPMACWMTKDDILAGFKVFGFSEINLIEDQFDHPNGPAILFTASKPDTSETLAT